MPSYRNRHFGFSRDPRGLSTLKKPTLQTFSHSIGFLEKNEESSISAIKIQEAFLFDGKKCTTL